MKEFDNGFVNWISNRIHEWGEPEQSTFKRIAFTRIGAIASLVVEIAANIFFMMKWCMWQVPGAILRETLEKILLPVFPGKNLKSATAKLPNLEDVYSCLNTLVKLIAGIASTCFFGILFSPEVNFRVHLKLGLAVDNLALKKERNLKNKLETELKTAEIQKARDLHAMKFQMETEFETNNKTNNHPIDSEFARIFL